MTDGPTPDANETRTGRAAAASSGFPAPTSGTVVVVGAGAAGCVVARRLADHGHRIVLLEAGPARHPAADPRLATLDHLGTHEVSDRWWHGVRSRRAERSDGFDYAAGRGLGGSSAVNGAMAEVDVTDPVLGPPHEVRTAAERLLVSVEGATRAETGPLGHLLLEHAGGRLVSLARRGGRRDDAATAYLARSPDRIDVRGDTEVDRIEPGESGATVITTGGTRIDAAAVVLCAGAIQTPAILLRSRLGSRVGEGLQDHPSVALDVVLRDRRTAPPLVTAAVAERGGIQLLPLEHVGDPADRAAALLVALMEPEGAAGTVELHDGVPVAEFRMDRSARDIDRLLGGVRWAIEVLTGPAAADVIADVSLGPWSSSGPGRALAELEDAALRERLFGTSGAYYHAAASCGLGRSLDDDGRLLTGEQIYVADAAAFPRIPRTGTHLPTMLQAERLSHRWCRGKMPA